MSNQEEGPNLWWQFLEFMGMTWPGKLKKPKANPTPAKKGICSACHNQAKYDKNKDSWYCSNHPNAQIHFEE
jgi:hypothetical protein